MQGRPHHTGRLIEDYDTSGPEHRSRLHRLLKIERHIEVLRQENGCRGATGLKGLQLPAPSDSPGEFEDLAHRNAERELVVARPFDGTADRVQLRPRALLRP